MIGRLKGRVLEKQAGAIVLDVHGIGFDVEVSVHTLCQLPALGDEAVLHIHHVVREDAQLLFGFGDRQERTLFRQLIKISGVGPKLALSILSGVTPSDLARFVRDDDAKALTRIPGVGKKTAERLLVELRDRLKEWDLVSPADELPLKGDQQQSQALHEAESALVALGYKPVEASKAIASVASAEQDLPTEELVRAALRKMVRG